MDFSRLLQMMGDKEDADDTQGIQPVASPVDVAVAGIPEAAASMAEAAPEILGNEIGSIGDISNPPKPASTFSQLMDKNAADERIAQAAKQANDVNNIDPNRYDAFVRAQQQAARAQAFRDRLAQQTKMSRLGSMMKNGGQ